MRRERKERTNLLQEQIGHEPTNHRECCRNGAGEKVWICLQEFRITEKIRELFSRSRKRSANKRAHSRAGAPRNRLIRERARDVRAVSYFAHDALDHADVPVQKAVQRATDDEAPEGARKTKAIHGER